MWDYRIQFSVGTNHAKNTVCAYYSSFTSFGLPFLINFLFRCFVSIDFIFRMEDIVKRIKAGFNLADNHLPADFLLTKLTEMKGCGCKVPRKVNFFRAVWFLAVGED